MMQGGRKAVIRCRSLLMTAAGSCGVSCWLGWLRPPPPIIDHAGHSCAQHAPADCSYQRLSVAKNCTVNLPPLGHVMADAELCGVLYIFQGQLCSEAGAWA
jgi:hypothetical protein